MPARKPLAPVQAVPLNRINLLAPTGPARLENARALPLADIDPNPRQARQAFDPAALQELKASVEAHGVLEPILVRPVGERYQIVAGERRYRAAVAAGLPTIPALIRDDLTDEDAAIVTALENLQREDLDLEDEARQLQVLLDVTGLSQRDLAKKLGVGHNYIAERVRLLTRPDLLAAYRDGTLTLRQALAEQRGAGGDTVLPEYNQRPLVERDDLGDADDLDLQAAFFDDEPPLGSGGNGSHGGTKAQPAPRWRALEAAYRPLKRIRPEAIPPAERGEWLTQLQDLRTYVTELIVAIDAEIAQEP